MANRFPLVVDSSALAIKELPSGDYLDLTGSGIAGDWAASGNVSLSGTGALKFPTGTTAQRPTASTGMVRFNTETMSFEGYNGSTWTAIGGGGQMYGNALTKAIHYNANTISENVTVLANTNGLSAGPITITNGYTVTVESNATWTIV